MNRTLWYVGLLVMAAGITLAAVPPGGTDGLIGTTADGGGPRANDVPVSLVSTGNVVTGSNQSTAETVTPQRRITTDSESPSSVTGATTEPTNGTPVAALVNDINEPVNVTYTAEIDDEAVEPGVATDRVRIPRGGQHLVYARCTTESAAAGTATLRITIQQTTVAEPTARDVTVGVEFQYDCPDEDASGATTADGRATPMAAVTAAESAASISHLPHFEADAQRGLPFTRTVA